MNKLPLIVGREFKAQMMTKSMAISTLITVVVILAIGVIARIFWTGDSGPEERRIGITQSIEPLATTLESTGYTLMPTGAESEDQIEIALDNEDFDLIAYVSGEPNAPTITAKEANAEVEQLTQILTAASQDYVLQDKLEPGVYDEVQSDLAQAATPTLNLTEDEREFDGMQMIVAVFTVMLIYMAVVMGVSMLAMGVVEEKTSRIVEILLTTIRPRELLMGKTLGIGSVVLLNILITVIASVSAAAIAGVLPQMNIWSKIPLMIVWVTLGYFLYASLTGGMAATITRQEEIGAITTPIILTTMVPFYYAFTMVPNSPDSTLTEVLSMVPFFSPFIMPVRSVFVDVPMWQTIVAISLCLITLPLIAAVSGKIYERSILHTGQRKSIMSALRG